MIEPDKCFAESNNNNGTHARTHKQHTHSKEPTIANANIQMNRLTKFQRARSQSATTMQFHAIKLENEARKKKWQILFMFISRCFYFHSISRCVQAKIERKKTVQKLSLETKTQSPRAIRCVEWCCNAATRAKRRGKTKKIFQIGRHGAKSVRAMRDDERQSIWMERNG